MTPSRRVARCARAGRVPGSVPPAGTPWPCGRPHHAGIRSCARHVWRDDSRCHDTVVPIARVALPVAAPGTFDYWVPETLAVARRRRRGATRTAPPGRRGPRRGPRQRGRAGAAAAGDGCRGRPAAANRSMLDLVQFVAAYYQEAIGLACALATPAHLAAPAPGAARERVPTEATTSPASRRALNPAQAAAVEAHWRGRGHLRALPPAAGSRVAARPRCTWRRPTPSSRVGGRC